SENLVDQFRVGERVNTSKTSKSLSSGPDNSLEQDVELPAEIIEELDLKKSSYLATLLGNRADDDIAYDEFMDYEQFLPLTLEDPDEVYDRTGEDADEISTFIKSFQYAGGTFFYVVVCWKCQVKNFQERMLIPVLSFPSTDQDLYHEFAIGERVVG